ncbi:MAG: polymer-forming cytoskeletal protein [Anaerolineae bacterium]
MKRLLLTIVLGMCLAALAFGPAPVLAAPGPQGDGNVIFGPYTLAAGNTATGDMTVFGGPATLKPDSNFNGDLTVFGTLDIEESANLNGTLVVFGDANIAGNVDGDVLVIGALVLRETAYVSGDVSATGAIDQRDGAVVDGEITPFSEREFDFDRDFPIEVPPPSTGPNPSVTIHSRPVWVQGLWNTLKAIVSVVVLSLLALVIVSIWPQQTERVGRAIEEAALTSFGMGLLVYLVAFIVLTLLAITICLSPFALLGWLVVGVGLLLGWIALGLILGKRILTSLFNQPQPQPVAAAVVGTAVLTLVLAMTRVFWPIHGILMFVLVPLATGAVLLTRFGTMPYATQGGVSTAPRAPKPPRPSGPILPGALPPSTPSAPAPAVDDHDIVVPAAPAGVSPFDEAERPSEEA